MGFAAKLRRALFGHIQSLSYTELDTTGTATLITRMTSDINQVQNGMNLALRLLLRSPFVVFGAMVMAFTIDWKAALVFVVAIPLLAAVVFGVMLWTMPRYQQVQGKLDKVLSATRENLTGVRVVRAFGREEAETQRFQAENQSLTKLQIFVGRVSALMNPATYVLINLATAVLIWVGALQVDGGILTQGEVVALINYMSQILVELIKLANLILNITKALACADRVSGVLEVEPSLCAPQQGRPGADSGVRFENVGLTYAGAGDASLSGISFSAKPGQTVGVIGGTGSGKSSLVNLIPRFYDATQGAVEIGRGEREGLALGPAPGSGGGGAPAGSPVPGDHSGEPAVGQARGQRQGAVAGPGDRPGRGLRPGKAQGAGLPGGAGGPELLRWPAAAAYHRPGPGAAA